MKGPGFAASFRLITLLALAATAGACAAPAAPGGPAPNAPASGQQHSSKTLVVAIHDEPGSLNLHPFTQPGQATYMIKRFVNAQLTYLDDQAAPHPYLAEALPQLSSDTWKVFPDGRMETTWKLKPNIVWHDGMPLSAQDFLLTWKVYSTPELGQVNTTPFAAMEGVSAPDDRTIVFTWKTLFPGAATMYEHNREYPALPRHLIAAAFEENAPETFINLPYWTTGFVGLGPYKLDRWESGSFLEAAAFDQHVLGRPKISRVRLTFMADDNAVIASLLSGDVMLTADAAARLSEVPLLKEQWVPTGAGAVNLHINQWRAVYMQFRPEYVSQKALLDSRVRTALAYSADRQAIADSVYGGEAPIGDFLLPPISDLGRAAEQAVTKHPLDPRHSEQLMGEASYTRGADGVYATPTAGRLDIQVVTQEASDNNAELAVLADGWQKAGFGIEQKLLTGVASRQPEVLATFPAMMVNSTSATISLIDDFRSANIPSPDNRWNGSNRGGWSNADYTSLAEMFAKTLDSQERANQVSQLARIFSGELPALTLFYRSVVFAHTTALTGLTDAPPESSVPWNMQDWELK